MVHLSRLMLTLHSSDRESTLPYCMRVGAGRECASLQGQIPFYAHEKDGPVSFLSDEQSLVRPGRRRRARRSSLVRRRATSGGA